MGDFFAQASFVSFCVASFLGVYLISHFRKELQLYLVFALFMLFAVWSLGLAMVQVSPTYEGAFLGIRIAFSAIGSLYAFFLHWTLLASESRWVQKTWNLVLLYLPAGAGILIFTLFPEVLEATHHFYKTPLGWMVAPTPHFWNWVFSAYITVFVLFGVRHLLRWMKRLQKPPVKKQASWLAFAALVAFAVLWMLGRIIMMLHSTIYAYSLPLTIPLLFSPFLIIFYTAVHYRGFFALSFSSENAGETETLDLDKKVRLYSFLALIYTLDGVMYVLYSYLVLQRPLHKLFPWGALFVLFGMLIHYLGTLKVREQVRDLLYVVLVSLVALVMAPRVHFLGEVIYASFFFTAVVVAILLGSIRVFILQGVLMGGILLFLWRPVTSLPVEKSFANLYELLFVFVLFYVLAFYVHRVYLQRLRENQDRLELQKATGEISALLAKVNYSNFESEFVEVLRAVDRFCGFSWRSFFLFSPVGRNATGAGKWCYGDRGSEETTDFCEELFLGLKGKMPPSGGFWLDEDKTVQEQDFLVRLGARVAFLQPVERGKEIWGFLGCCMEKTNFRGKVCQELVEALSYRLTDVLARIAQEKALHYSAFYDSLTGLPNRALFQEHLEKAIQLAKRTGEMVCVLFADLDNFKTVNDTGGHETGDLLLRMMAQRLSGCVREQDVVTRFGGDEFLVLLTRINCPEEVLPIVERIKASFQQPFVVHNQEFFLNASIGIALYPRDGSTPQELIKNADLAMYTVKSQGKGDYAFCSPEMKGKF